MSRHAVLLCEGYHDRAFWAGLLRERGWADARGPSGRARDPLHETVSGGRFAYRRGESFVVVVPCGGQSKIAEAARRQFTEAWNDRAREGRIDHVIACFDADAGETGNTVSIRDRWTEAFTTTPPAGPTWTQDGVRVDVVFLRPTEPALPASLDGLVAEAFSLAHVDRHAAVEAWLASRPTPPAPSKEAMWSIMAGWFAEQGCEAFLQHGLWSDSAVKANILAAADRCGLLAMLTAVEA